MSHLLFDLSGRVAVVSGAASGLGKAMATALAEVGADLVLADIDPDGMQRTAGELEALGRRVLQIECDMSDSEQIRAMYQQVDREYGRNDEKSDRRPPCFVPGSGPADDRGGQGQHHQPDLYRRHHRPGAQPPALLHGHGRGRPDDA